METQINIIICIPLTRNKAYNKGQAGRWHKEVSWLVSIKRPEDKRPKGSEGQKDQEARRIRKPKGSGGQKDQEARRPGYQ